MGGSHRASEPKPAGSPAAQAFCAAKPWRRRNLLPPSMSNQKGSRKSSDFWESGKKKMRNLGTVQVPTEAFLAVLKLDE